MSEHGNSSLTVTPLKDNEEEKLNLMHIAELLSYLDALSPSDRLLFENIQKNSKSCYSVMKKRKIKKGQYT